MNKVILTGRVANDLELRATPSGSFVCDFNLATNRPVNREGERVTDFINCRVWNKQAENFANYQGKGSLIAVFGEIRVDAWKNEQGEKRYKTYVLVNNIEFLESKKTAVDKEEPVEENNPYEEFGTENNTGLIDDDSLPF